MRVVLGVAVLGAGCAPLARPADPLSAQEHNDLGVAYYARGQHALAAREFRRALALRPTFTRALVNLGDARLATGDVDGAIEAYEGARAASPEDPAIANNLAWALLQHERRWPEAEPVIRDALARRPEPRGYYLDTLGVLLLRKDQPGSALEALRTALTDQRLSDPQVRALVLRHTGEAHARLGNPEAAERCYRLAQALSTLPREAGDAGNAGRQTPPPKVGQSDTVC